MTLWQKDALLLSYIISHFPWFGKLQHWFSTLHRALVKPVNHAAQCRPEWADPGSWLQPSSGQRCYKFQMYECVCARMCSVYIKDDAALHTCTSRHWLGLSLSSPLSSLTPAVPSHDPLESRDGPIVLCYPICTYWHLTSRVPPRLIIPRLWYTSDTERTSELCIRCMLSCTLWGGNTIGRMSRPNPSRT